MQPNLVARSAGRVARADYAAWAQTSEGRAAGGDSVARLGSDVFGADRLDAILRELNIARDADGIDDAFERGFSKGVRISVGLGELLAA